MKLALSGPHQLDLATLRARIDARVEFYDRKYPHIGLRQHYAWDSEHDAHATYRGGAGRMTLARTEVRIELELPFFARLARDRIEAFIRSEMTLVLQPPNAEQR